LELKEESEKAKLWPVKEKRSFKRFDLFSALAVLGILLVLLFEGAFIFEFYRFDLSALNAYLPASWKVSESAEEVMLEPTAIEANGLESAAEGEPVPSDDSERIPVKKESTDADEPVPVG
jgi:hypothetical protein